MKKHFIFRTWPADKTERLKELWWQGKSPKDICKILKATSPDSVREKANREGFIRDPRIATLKSNVLQPAPRSNGDLVTMRNCEAHECRWPYGPAGIDMVMCGRPIKRGAYCEGHCTDKAKP